MEDVLLCVINVFNGGFEYIHYLLEGIKRLSKRCRIGMLFSNPINLSLSWTWLLRLQQHVHILRINF